MNFVHEEYRIYATNEAGKIVAEVSFPLAEPGVYNIDRTFVDPSLRGQGIAGQLLSAAVADIRLAGGKTKASCSYAIAWFHKNHDQRDILV